MNAKYFRQKAWEKLSGKWGIFALITLIFNIILCCSSFLAFLLAGPLEMGFTICALKVAENQELNIENLFDGFKDFLRTFLVNIIQVIFILLWSLLLIIPGIIKALAYSMSYFVLRDNPELSAYQAIKKSEQLMDGHKWQLFCLSLSFIGWLILVMLTFGILSFWVEPYMTVAMAEFYKEITSQTATEKIETEQAV